MMIKRLKDAAVVMNYLDQVALAKNDLRKGEALRRQSGYIRLKNFIPKGERFALRDIKNGEYITQYGFP
ncbi:MAG: hypothetical protein PHQ96_04760, partial [Candidatus Omnitrophica bacterium]|nr:hypothetical protein [Candidatus Omnitrophota bacterium]